MIDIKKILQDRKATQEEIDTLLGRLNHAAGALPIVRYFLNRLRLSASNQTDSTGPQIPKRKIRWLSKPALRDLQLFHDVFLQKINVGINLNLLTYRRPTHILFSDACPKGLGGCLLNTGKAWRWEMPSEFADSVQLKNNLLEFLAAVITIWLELLDKSTPHLSCILALGDNTSAVGWLHKTNVDESNDKALHLTSRKLAMLLLDFECCIYSQHFKGAYNEVADTLSRRHNLSDTDLLSLIISTYPE
jgi:hypothetical protein